MERKEYVTPGNCEGVELAPGVLVRILASGGLGSEGLTVCTATVKPGAELPYHTHPSSEVILCLSGKAEALVEGRRYYLTPHDAIHVPAGVAHSVRNGTGSPCVLHTSFPTGKPDREFVEPHFVLTDRDASDDSVPETVVRFSGFDQSAESKEVQTHILFEDETTPGFNGRLIHVPPHRLSIGTTSRSDRAITALEGKVTCGVLGREHSLTNTDTLGIPASLIADTVNRSDEPLIVAEITAPRH